MRIVHMYRLFLCICTNALWCLTSQCWARLHMLLDEVDKDQQRSHSTVTEIPKDSSCTLKALTHTHTRTYTLTHIVMETTTKGLVSVGALLPSKHDFFIWKNMWPLLPNHPEVVLLQEMYLVRNTSGHKTKISLFGNLRCHLVDATGLIGNGEFEKIKC